MLRRSPGIALALIAALLALLAAVIWAPVGVYERLLGRDLRPISGTVLIGGPFSLTDQTGRAVTDRTFRGKPMLIFFGYSLSPDETPASLQVMSAALRRLGAKSARVQPIFVTLDPVRDTADVLARYVSRFDPRLLGLTGSPAAIAEMAEAYRVVSERVADKSLPGGYAIEHSPYIYLMGADGIYVTHFEASDGAEAIAAALARVL